MATYRRKPSTVEATQFFVLGDHPAVLNTFSGLIVQGKQGFSTVRPGDFIVAELDGSGFYPCNPEVFALTYEPVESFDDCDATAEFRA